MQYNIILQAEELALLSFAGPNSDIFHHMITCIHAECCKLGTSYKHEEVICMHSVVKRSIDYVNSTRKMLQSSSVAHVHAHLLHPV